MLGLRLRIALDASEYGVPFLCDHGELLLLRPPQTVLQTTVHRSAGRLSSLDSETVRLSTGDIDVVAEEGDGRNGKFAVRVE